MKELPSERTNNPQKTGSDVADVAGKSNFQSNITQRAGQGYVQARQDEQEQAQTSCCRIM